MIGTLQSAQKMARVTHTSEESTVAIHSIYKNFETRDALQRSRVKGLGVGYSKFPLRRKEEGQSSWGPVRLCSSQARLGVN